MLTGRKIRHLVLLVMTVGIVSCAPREEIIEPKPPSFDRPIIEPLPLRVGYAFDREVDRELLGRVDDLGGPVAPVRLRLGPATRGAFGRVFAAAFVDPVDLARETPGRGSAAPLDGTIRLGVVDVWIGNVIDEGTAVTRFELVFLNPDGSEEGSWQVRGGAAGSGPRKVELAIRAAAAEVASKLDRQPAIRSWLERGGAGRAGAMAE
jgi:hypothetical protein